MSNKAKKGKALKIILVVLGAGAVITGAFFGIKAVMKKPEGRSEDNDGGGEDIIDHIPPPNPNPPAPPLEDFKTANPALVEELKYLRDNYRFKSDMANAQKIFDAKNAGIIPAELMPTDDSLKLALKNKEWAYFQGKIENRMPKIDVENIIKTYATSGKGTGSVSNHPGQVNTLGAFPVIKLQKMLAHGWWFGLKDKTGSGSYNGYEYGDNIGYILYPLNYLNNTNPRYSGILIPENVLPSRYAYFTGNTSEKYQKL